MTAETEEDVTADLRILKAAVVSLAEVVTEMVQASAGGNQADHKYASLVHDTLRSCSHALGFNFQGDLGDPGAREALLAQMDEAGR